MSILFFIIVSFFMVKDRQIYHNWITPFNILAFPFAIIILLNNCIFRFLGFYTISSLSIILIASSLFLFYLGENLFAGKFPLAKQNNKYSYKKKLNNYYIKYMLYYSVSIETISYLRLIIMIINKGVNWLVSDQNEGFVLTGIIGHLALSLYVIIPILLIYWLYNRKDYKYLIVSVAYIFLLFLTFVKYHIICFFVLCFILIGFEKPKYFVRGLIGSIGSIIILFVLNYAVTFLIKGSLGDVQLSFYINHLWKYTAGSVINTNYVVTTGINVNYSVLYKIISLFTALPNMVLHLLKINPVFVTPSLELLPMGVPGEESNVINLFGYLFPANPSVLNLVIYAIFVIGFGYICYYIFSNIFLNCYIFDLFAFVFFTFFTFFAFFSIYESLSGPWEVLCWAIIAPIVFCKKSRFNIKRAYLYLNRKVVKNGK